MTTIDRRSFVTLLAAAIVAPAAGCHLPAHALVGRRLEAAIAYGDALSPRVPIDVLELDMQSGRFTFKLHRRLFIDAPFSNADPYLEIYEEGASEWSIRCDLYTGPPVSVGQTIEVRA